MLKVKILTDFSVGEWGSDTVLEKRLRRFQMKPSAAHVEFLYGNSVHSYFLLERSLKILT